MSNVEKDRVSFQFLIDSDLVDKAALEAMAFGRSRTVIFRSDIRTGRAVKEAQPDLVLLSYVLSDCLKQIKDSSLLDRCKCSYERLSALIASINNAAPAIDKKNIKRRNARAAQREHKSNQTQLSKQS
jgi:hypothetical protein